MTQVFKIPRQPNGSGFYLHFTGGFRAANVSKDTWQIEPVFINSAPSATGLITMSQLQKIARKNNFHAVAFHRFGWTDGEYHSSWSPIIPGEDNHSEGPAELWSHIAGNISQPRTKEFFKGNEYLSNEKIAEVLDNQEPVEALSQYISLSLSNMNIGVEQIAEHYHEQLVNHMARGRLDGERSANTLSQTLYAHVHSFFLHLGATRDYFAALIAHRIGLDHKKIDSMARLVGELRQENLPQDALLELLIENGDIAAHPYKSGKLAVAGWMQEVTEIRNELVHKRPYGSKFKEHFGWVIPTQKEAGLYRYFRPIDMKDATEHDVFDVLHYHYKRCTDLMHKAAKASGNDTAMMCITEEDIISFEVRGEGNGSNIE